MLSCDWCEGALRGKQAAYALEGAPFFPLNLNRKDDFSGRGIAAERHFHEDCLLEVFKELLAVIDNHEPVEQAEQDHAIDPDIKRWEQTDRHSEWRSLADHEQNRMVLEAITSGWSTNSEICERLRTKEGPCPYTGAQGVSATTKRLFDSGELEREKGQWGKAKVRYRRKELSDDLKHLAEQLKTDPPDDL